MLEILKKAEEINDERQKWKTKHKLMDVVGIVLFAMLANADGWEEVEDFAYANEGFLHKYFDAEFREKIKKNGDYLRTIEKAHGQTEIREYYQTNDVNTTVS